MSAKKPTVAAIRAALPLTALQVGRPDFVCVVCGGACPEDELQAWRECDERDRPLGGVDAVVFLGGGREHAACRKRLTDHPRLYIETPGDPGTFPRLCGSCVYRDGRTCRHPDLRANGGQGLRVDISDPFRGAIICTRPGIAAPVRHAVACVGRKETV